MVSRDSKVDYFAIIIIIIINYSFRDFHISASWWSSTGVWVTASLLKTPGFFSVFLAVLNNAVVSMVSTRPPTSKSSRPFNNPLLTVPKAPITIIIIIITHLSFSHQRKLMVFHWRLSDSKSPQLSRTLLSIMAVFNNAVVWMVSTRLPTSKYY